MLSKLFCEWQLDGPAGSNPLTEDQADILKEAFNIGVGQSATSLSGLLGGESEVVLSVPQVEFVSIEHLAARISPDGADVCAVVQQYSGPISGKAQLIYNASESLELAREIIGSDTPIESIAEMETDALSEIGNIVLNACISTFGNMFSIEVATNAPEVVTDSALQVLSDFGARTPTEQVLYLRMDFILQHRNLQGHLSLTMGSRELDSLMHHVDQFLEGMASD